MKLKSIIISALVCVMAVGAQVPASNEDNFAKGIDEFDSGRWIPAADLFCKAAVEQPRDEVVRLTTGVALANVGRYPEAANQFDAAARITPEGVIPLMLLDRTYAEMGRAAESKQARGAANAILASGKAFGTTKSSDRALADSLVKYPRNAIAVSLLGDSLQLEGRLEAAKERYAKAASLAPKWTKPVFNLGLANLPTDAKAAEASFQQVIAIDPANSQAHLWLGDAYLKQGKSDKAIEAYTVAGKDKALLAESQTRIGNAQMRAGNFKVAQDLFATAEANAPQDPRPVAGQAQVFQNTNQPAAAESKFNQAGEIVANNSASPKSQAVVRGQLAQVQAAQGKTADAYQNYNRAFDLQPTISNGYALADSVNWANGLPESIASYQAALAKNPKDVRAMVFLLAACKLQGDHKGRLDMATRLAKADPANTVIYRAEIGCAKMALGDENGALDAFAQAIDFGDPSTWEATGRAANECGALDKLTAKYDRAFALRNDPRAGKVVFEMISVKGDAALTVEVGQKLARRMPDDPSVLLRLGEAYEKAGRISEAVAVYTRVTILPNTAAAALARGRIGALKAGK
jgi:tetratricopeptide (TPR) repeat protein